jgi:putative Mg2+ transporter-C (MgtC) family protein
MEINWEFILRLFLALLFGGVIGYERESEHKPAGLRTNLLVCLGSCLVVLFELFYHQKNPGVSDHLRMAAQILTGIGFLGAGTIIQTRSHVKGLTTAATIWVTATIGIAVGGGFYYISGIAVIVVLLSLRFLKIIENRLTLRSGRSLIINGESKGNFSEKFGELMTRLKIPIFDVKLSVDRNRSLEATVYIHANVDVDMLIAEIMKIDGVHRVTTELLLE